MGAFFSRPIRKFSELQNNYCDQKTNLLTIIENANELIGQYGAEDGKNARRCCAGAHLCKSYAFFKLGKYKSARQASRAAVKCSADAYQRNRAEFEYQLYNLPLN